jgi:hypothetical protein
MFARSLLIVAMSVVAIASTAVAKSPADLNDLEIAHVAYTADSIDIRYATWRWRSLPIRPFTSSPRR